MDSRNEDDQHNLILREYCKLTGRALFGIHTINK